MIKLCLSVYSCSWSNTHVAENDKAGKGWAACCAGIVVFVVAKDTEDGVSKRIEDQSDRDQPVVQFERKIACLVDFK